MASFTKKSQKSQIKVYVHAFQRVVGVQRAKTFGRNPQIAKLPLAVKNGERGEKCDSISRGGEQDRLPFV